MRILSTFLLVVVAAAAAVHGYFYWRMGTLDPCEAAVVRIIQKQRGEGQDLMAGLGVIFSEMIKDAIRTEGVVSCYRTALTGEAPDIEKKLRER